MSTDAVLIGMGALDGKELFIIEGSEKLALNSGTTRGARKMTQNASKTPLIAATAESRVPVSVAGWNVHQFRDELNLVHFHCHA